VGWRTIDEQREAVDFDVREGLDGIADRSAALDDGLVVLPRESAGTVADAPTEPPLARRRPHRCDCGSNRSRLSNMRSWRECRLSTRRRHVRMTAGLGRPLILTTLERDEAMRVLAGDAPRDRSTRSSRWRSARSASRSDPLG
jgi:hypothetical protein